MVLRILGIALAVWIVLAILGSLFKFLVWALVIGAVLFLGAAAYTAIKKRNNRALR
ncbi:MAG: LPXTG cell wall anchor domain-containing protein [Pseudonocardia sp.]|nr:LPXTG cell wall anchor domain-containing protein [Pseudonocardia sp.]